MRYIHTSHSILPSFIYNVHEKDVVVSLIPASLKILSFIMIFLWAAFACVYITPASLGVIVLATCSSLFFIRMQSWSCQGTTKFAEALATIQRGAFVAAQLESATALRQRDMQTDLNKLMQKTVTESLLRARESQAEEMFETKGHVALCSIAEDQKLRAAVAATPKQLNYLLCENRISALSVQKVVDKKNEEANGTYDTLLETLGGAFLDFGHHFCVCSTAVWAAFSTAMDACANGIAEATAGGNGDGDGDGNAAAETAPAGGAMENDDLNAGGAVGAAAGAQEGANDAGTLFGLLLSVTILLSHPLPSFPRASPNRHPLSTPTTSKSRSTLSSATPTPQNALKTQGESPTILPML